MTKKYYLATANVQSSCRTWVWFQTRTGTSLTRSIEICYCKIITDCRISLVKFSYKFSKNLLNEIYKIHETGTQFLYLMECIPNPYRDRRMSPHNFFCYDDMSRLRNNPYRQLVVANDDFGDERDTNTCFRSISEILAEMFVNIRYISQKKIPNHCKHSRS